MQEPIYRSFSVYYEHKKDFVSNVKNIYNGNERFITHNLNQALI